jgi:hypothetical protein
MEIGDEVSLEMGGSAEALIDGFLTVMVGDPDVKKLMYFSVAAMLHHEGHEDLGTAIARAASLDESDEEA